MFGDNEPAEKEPKAYKADLTSDFNNKTVLSVEDVDDFLLLEKVKLSSSDSSGTLSYLHGDSEFEPGDFRSKEVTELKEQADIIITNPPFSLFREFIKWINPYEKKFLIMGPLNAVSYRELMPLVKEDIIHLGVSNGTTNFRVPDSYTPRKNRFWIDEAGQKWYSLGNVEWFTNLGHGNRHCFLSLMTMKDNLEHSPHKKIREQKYVKYNNYDAIEVPFVDAIPSDYKGVMGVPITFLNKYNPDQFEIVQFRKGNDGKDLNYTKDGKLVYPYMRILIRAKKETLKCATN